MRLSGYQPQYFPRLHYFARMLDSDIFELSDYVQFVKKHAYPTLDGTTIRGKSYQADTPLKGPEGLCFLSVPVSHGGLLPLHQTKIASASPWVEKHLKSIENAYGKSPSVRRILPSLTALLTRTYDSLAHLNVSSILWSLSWILDDTSPSTHLPLSESLVALNQRLSEPHPFRLKKIILMSETSIPPPGEGRDANDWIIDICRTFGASEYYLGGTSATAYTDVEKFKQAGITLLQQNWTCASYRQRHPQAGFLPNLSIIDLLANEEPATVQSILKTE